MSEKEIKRFDEGIIDLSISYTPTSHLSVFIGYCTFYEKHSNLIDDKEYNLLSVARFGTL